MYDNNAVVLGSNADTGATQTNASGADYSADYLLPSGTPFTGIPVTNRYTAAATSSGSGTAITTVEAKDSAGNYTTVGTFPTVTLGTTAVAGEKTIRVSAPRAVALRAKTVLTGTGATITNQVKIGSGDIP